MKYLALSIYSILVLSLNAQMGQLPNGDFENWTNTVIFDYPTEWGNSNISEYRGIPTVYQSTDASTGSYSVEIHSELAGMDTVFGYVYHGVIGQAGPEGGIEYADQFDEVQFQYKCDISTDDSLYVLIIRFNGGSMIEMLMVPAIGGTQNNWTAASVPVTNTMQDSLFIGFVMGDPFNSIYADPGSWARIDDVHLFNASTETSALPDPSFENWSTADVEVADDWYSLAEMFYGSGINNTVKTTDAYSGSFAIEMSTVLEPNFGDTMRSFLSYGPIVLNGPGSPFTAAPYVATPTNFSGAYKYSAANGDVGVIQIQFFAGGAMIGNHGEVLTNNPTYTTFSSAITIAGVPDSMAFIVSSGDNPGSVLILDNLSFSGGNVSLTNLDELAFNVYPNPFASNIEIKAEGNFEGVIVDMIGNVVSGPFEVNQYKNVELTDLPSGTYLLQLTNDNERLVKRIIKE